MDFPCRPLTRNRLWYKGLYMRKVAAVMALVLALALGWAGTSAQEELTPVRLQLQWVAQSQFAGYYAALAQGYYEAEGLDVTILEGAVEIVRSRSWRGRRGIRYRVGAKVLESREAGADR